MYHFKLVDGIIEEPLGGAHTDMKKQSTILKRYILESIKQLKESSPQERISQRIDKFTAMGVVH